MGRVWLWGRSFIFLAACCLPIFAHSAEIEFFSPQGEVKKVRQVAVRFSKQMVNFGDPREVAPFDISCPESGKGRWADQRNWVYDFDADLPAGVSCSFRLKNGLKTLDGEAVEDQADYSFNTGGPAILRSVPREGAWSIDENQVFILGLDAPASAESIKQHAGCLVDGIPEQIPVRLITGNERKTILKYRTSFLTSYYLAVFKRGRGAGHTVLLGVDEKGSDREKFLKLRDGAHSPIVVLQCTHALPNDTKVRLVWGQGITSESGIPTSSSQSLAFKTRPVFDAKFSCQRVNQDADCIPVLPMELYFSAPISTSDARNIKLVEPDGKIVHPNVPKTDDKYAFVQNLSFPVPLPEKTTFRLVLPHGLKDDAGRALVNASSFPLQVHTDENPPLAKFSADFGIIELNASRSVPPMLPVTLRNLEASLQANMAMVSPADGSTIPAINGQALHTVSPADVIDWMRRIQQSNQVSYHYDQDLQKSVMDRGPGLTSVFAGDQPGKSFVIPRTLGKKAFEVVGIPLKAPGFYVVELASPKLGEALLGEKRPYYVHTSALVTNLSVHFKLGRESSLVWVTSLDHGDSVAGAKVAVRDCSGKVYYQGTTDSQGILRINEALPGTTALPGCMQSYDKQYFVTARYGRDFSFVLSSWSKGIAPWRFNAYQGGWGGKYIAHAVMDRTLLRAGETVHMKLFLRQHTRAGFSLVDFALPDSITIVHQGGNERYPVAVNWDGDGTTAVDWVVPKDAKQGTYLIQIPESRFIMGNAGSFRVESFRVPTMKAILQGPATPLINADMASLNIQVNYLSGGGASYLPVKLRGQFQPKTVTFPDYEEYTFANGSLKVGPEAVGSEPWYMGSYLWAMPGSGSPTDNGKLLPTQSLQLDSAGAAKASFPDLPKSSVPRDIEAELEYSDPDGEILTAATRIALWPSRVVVGIKPDGWIVSKDHLKFRTVVLDLDGKPVSGAQVKVVALQREYFSHRRRLLGGFYAYENDRQIKLLGPVCQGRTDDKGLLLCDVKSPAAGNIILQASASDATGNVSSANRGIWVAGSDNWWFDATDNDRIDLLPEKKRYEPGEMARFQLRMPFEKASVLVTVEREGVMRSFVVHLTRKNPIIWLPILGNYAPNIFVSALAVRGRVAGIEPTAMIDLAKPAFKMGLAEIKVGWGAHELKVKVATDKSVYKIRQKAKVSIDVQRPDGSVPPPGSEIALAAVDEGLLQLKPNDSWKLLDAMMRRRGIEVTTSTAQMQVVGKRHFGRKALAAGGGGGGGVIGRKSARQLFDTLLFWKARVKLDAHGHAVAEVPLNDSLTAFRIVAIADVGMGLFGTGSASIHTTQDLMLMSGLPPLVREQDRYHAGFTVRNATNHPMDVTVSAMLDLSGTQNVPVLPRLTPIKVHLPAGEARNVGWEVRAPVGGKELKWDVSVRADGAQQDGDRIKVSEKVIPAVPVRTLQATIMQLENTQSINVKLPDGAIPGKGGVQVNFRRHLADGLAGVREFMSRYPFTCFEQQASQAVALQDKDGWNALMNRLPDYLDSDGLVKYFPIMSQGDDTLTAYLLSVADEAGYTIPESAKQLMRSGLAGFVEGRVIRYSALPTADLNIRKLAAIAALSRDGAVNKSWLDSIPIEPNLWPTSAVLDWMFILQHAPDLDDQPARLKEAQQILRSRLNFQGTTMGFSTERSDALWWLMINADVNASRMLLEVMDMDQWRPDVPRLVRGTLGRQQHGHWNTTVANAWGVLAMKRFSEKFESIPVTGSSTAAIGKSMLVADWTEDEKHFSKILAWPAGAAPLSLAHAGKGKPWVSVQSLAALPLKKPLFTGYRIDRRIIPIEQKTKGSWHKGDVVRVHLDVEAQSDMTWVVIDDPVPAGATILGTGLGGDSALLTQGEKKQGWVWPAFEERKFDSFRAYYRYMPKGKMTVEYTLRLNNDGDFNLPPTRVEAMYAPEMFGELPNEKLQVKP